MIQFLHIKTTSIIILKSSTNNIEITAHITHNMISLIIIKNSKKIILIIPITNMKVVTAMNITMIIISKSSNSSILIKNSEIQINTQKGVNEEQVTISERFF